MRSLFKNSFLFVLTAFIYSCTIAQEKTVEKSFEGLESISANFSSGDLILQKGNTSTVSVSVVYTFDENRFTPKMEQNGSRLLLEEKFKSGSSSGWAKWTLVVPDGMEIKVNSGSGDIEASKIEVNIDSNTGSGDMELTDVMGEIEVNSGSGNVKLSNHSGDMAVNTGSGDVNIDNSKGEVDVNAGSGDIKLASVSGEFSINTGSGDIEANQITVIDDSNFNSGSGNTEVSLGNELDHDISLNSGSGNSILDFNGFEISGEIVMKANKRNGEIEAPFPFDSSVEEENGNQTIIKKTAKIGSKNLDIRVGTGSGKAVIKK